MTEERNIGIQMIGEPGQTRLSRVHIRQGDHRGGRAIRGVEKEREFIDEIAKCCLGSRDAFVCLRRQSLLGNAEFVAKEADLVLLCFEIFMVPGGDDEIEQQKAGADEFRRVPPAIAEIFALDQSVQSLGKEMIDTTEIQVLAPRGVAVSFDLSDQVLGALPPTGSGERDELAGEEIAGVRGHNVEEARLVRGVAESLNGLDVLIGDFHRDRISAVSSRSSRMRRSRSASPRGVYKEKPARTFSATCRPR